MTESPHSLDDLQDWSGNTPDLLNEVALSNLATGDQAKFKSRPPVFEGLDRNIVSYRTIGNVTTKYRSTILMVNLLCFLLHFLKE